MKKETMKAAGASSKKRNPLHGSKLIRLLEKGIPAPSCLSDGDSSKDDVAELRTLLHAFQSAPPKRTAAQRGLASRASRALVAINPPIEKSGLLPNFRCEDDIKLACELRDRHAVEAYLSLAAERDQGLAIKHLQSFTLEGTPLTPKIAPRLFRLIKQACNRLRFEVPVEVTSLRDPTPDATALLIQRVDRSFFLQLHLTAGLLETLDDAGLLFVLGHEIGHLLSSDRELFRLGRSSGRRGAKSLLPSRSESIFLRWRRIAELSADRAGLIACDDLNAACKAISKLQTGLGSRNIISNPDALVKAWEETGSRFDAAATHPPLPVRIKALHLFANSDSAKKLGVSLNKRGKMTTTPEMEAEVSALVQRFKRHPSEKEEIALMETVAIGGAIVLACDGEIGEGEVRILIDILHREFTEEPETLIPSMPEEFTHLLELALAEIRASCNDIEKQFVIECLAEIAAQDANLHGREIAAILEIGQKMGLAREAAQHAILTTMDLKGFGDSGKTAKTQKRQ